jgi:hypothetical protein
MDLRLHWLEACQDQASFDFRKVLSEIVGPCWLYPAMK